MRSKSISPKLLMARKMMSKVEIRNKISPFDSKAWNERKKILSIKVHNREV